MTLTLGFDVGTSRSKALIYETTQQRVLACASEPTPVSTSPLGDQRDPDELWTVLARLCHRLDDAGAPLARVAGISLAALGEEIVYLDARGLPTGLVSCWYVEQPADAAAGRDLPPFRLAGWYSICAASRRADPAFRSARSFTDLGSSLLTRMVGAEYPHMDRSHASRTGLLDSTTGDWSSERLRSCGVENLRPPELVNSGIQVGVLDAPASAHLGLSIGVPVRAGAHDHICAALAAGAETSGDVFVSVGTSESRLVLLDLSWQQLAKWEQPDREIGFFADGRHRYLHTSRASGRRIAELVSKDPSGRDIAAVYASLADIVITTSDGTLELPGRAADIDSTAADLFAELDRQARESAAAINKMAEVIGDDTRRIRIIGVPTQHEIWRRIRSQRSNRPLEFVQLEEPAAIGAALLAMGIIRGNEE